MTPKHTLGHLYFFQLRSRLTAEVMLQRSVILRQFTSSCTFLSPFIDTYSSSNYWVYSLSSIFSGVNLHMVVRNCISDLGRKFENICYDRNSDITSLIDLKEILSFFQDKLAFLGRGSVEVVAFNGRQCYCSNNLCRPYIVGGSSRTSGYTAALVFALLVSILM